MDLLPSQDSAEVKEASPAVLVDSEASEDESCSISDAEAAVSAFPNLPTRFWPNEFFLLKNSTNLVIP
jgi:hypothetical protein